MPIVCPFVHNFRFYRRMISIPWTERRSSDEGLEKWKQKGHLEINTRKRQLKFLGNIKRKEDTENLTGTGPNEVKKSSRKQRINYQTRLCKCLAEQGVSERVKTQNILKTTKYRKLWRVTTANDLIRHSWSGILELN